MNIEVLEFDMSSLSLTSEYLLFTSTFFIIIFFFFLSVDIGLLGSGDLLDVLFDGDYLKCINVASLLFFNGVLGVFVRL